MTDTTESICKAGFARDDASCAVSLPIVVRPKKPNIVVGTGSTESYVVMRRKTFKGVLTLKHPIEPDIVIN